MTTSIKSETVKAPQIEEPATHEAHDAGAVREVLALLDSWANATEEEIQEQVETWEFLRQALDEDRPSFRKLFP